MQSAPGQKTTAVRRKTDPEEYFRRKFALFFILCDTFGKHNSYFGTRHPGDDPIAQEACSSDKSPIFWINLKKNILRTAFGAQRLFTLTACSAISGRPKAFIPGGRW
jgi:hypothetical protein